MPCTFDFTDLAVARGMRSRDFPCICTGIPRAISEVHDNLSPCSGWHPNVPHTCDCSNGRERESCRCKSVPPMIVSYDCNCQFSAKVLARYARSFPDLMGRLAKTRFTIPVVHLKDHRDNCEYLYASAYLKGAGHFYGEQAEVPWAEFNQLGGRTRQMGTGLRHDVLNAHLNDWNYRKMLTMSE